MFVSIFEIMAFNNIILSLIVIIILSGISYPIKWRVLLPEYNLELIVSTRVKQQEWAKKNGFSFNYWEGAVNVAGTRDGMPVTGRGYVELTGYEQSSD